MKRVLTVLVLAILFTSCKREALRNDKTNNKDFQVDFLFEHNGIKMYRFFDEGHYHYFTSKNETITSQTSGKSSYEDNIN